MKERKLFRDIFEQKRKADEERKRKAEQERNKYDHPPKKDGAFYVGHTRYESDSDFFDRLEKNTKMAQRINEQERISQEHQIYLSYKRLHSLAEEMAKDGDTW